MSADTDKLIAQLRKERDDAHTEWALMQATAIRHRERAEVAEAQRDRWERLYELELGRANKAEGEAFTLRAAEAQRDTLAKAAKRYREEVRPWRDSWRSQLGEQLDAALAAVTTPEAGRNYGTPTLPVTLQALLHTDDDDAPPEEPEP